MLPPAPLDRFLVKVFKDVSARDCPCWKQNLPHSSPFRWSSRAPRGNWLHSGEKVDWRERNKHAESKHSRWIAAHLEENTDHRQLTFWINSPPTLICKQHSGVWVFRLWIVCINTASMEKSEFIVSENLKKSGVSCQLTHETHSMAPGQLNCKDKIR